MTLRKTLASGLGIATLVALGACAEARPIGYGPDSWRDGRGFTSRAAGYELEVLSNGVLEPRASV